MILPEYDPQIRRRTELGAHDSSEYGSRSGYVEELDHEYLPRRHYNEIDSVRFRYGRGFSGDIRVEDFLDQFTVEKISGDKRQKAYKKRYHSGSDTL